MSETAIKNVILAQDLHKFFDVGVQKVEVLRGLNFKINPGDFAVIFGPSGCGKSTLLHVILGLEIPSSGTMKVLGQDIYKGTVSTDQRSEFRKAKMGMVFQQSNWVKALTVVENVAFPLLLLGEPKIKAVNKARKLLEEVGMIEWADYVPTELSGGQQQRISLARALINDPQVIVADEPTGNLDYSSGLKIMELLTELNKERKKTVIMVTHDLEYINYANRAIQMLDGQIVDIYGEGDKEKLIKQIREGKLKKITEEESKKNAGVNNSNKEQENVIEKEGAEKKEDIKVEHVTEIKTDTN